MPIRRRTQPSVTSANAVRPTPTHNNTSATTASAKPPIASASGQITQPRTVAFGLAGHAMSTGVTTNRFARQASFDTYGAVGEGPVMRGFLQPSASAIPGGFRLNIKSFHKSAHSCVSLFLLAEVFDQKTKQFRTITLSVLTDREDLSGDGFRGDHHFDVSYDDLNGFLQKRNPDLHVVPGQTKLAVSGVWNNGHQAGGFARGGTFRLPLSAQIQSIVSIRGAAPAHDDTPLPLDMQIGYPLALTQALPVLKSDGSIVTRLESEYKGEVEKVDMTRAVSQMYKLAAQCAVGDNAEAEKLLGKGWTIETVNRYWLKDDGTHNDIGNKGMGYCKGFRVDDDGLPIQDPMTDQYMDDDALGMTREQGAIRLRSNKQATMINVKPGGGRIDDRTAIRQRIEVGLELDPGTSTAQASDALKLLAGQTWAGTIFNHAQTQVRKLNNTLVLSDCLKPWLQVVQDRHKFTAKNKDGVEIEFSFDKVKCKTTRPSLANPDGSPREVEFYVLEAELDHLQIGSSNQSKYAELSTSRGGAFSSGEKQDEWLRSTSDQVTMNIDPRLHELQDLDNAAFRSTSSYRAFEAANKKLRTSLFPKGLRAGKQKAAAAAEKLGLINFDGGCPAKAIVDIVRKGGFRVTPQIEDAATKAAGDQALAVMMINGSNKNTFSFIRKVLGNVVLDYDIPQLISRVAGRLRDIGLSGSDDVLSIFDGLTSTNIPPAQMDRLLDRMATHDDDNALSEFAAAIGVSSKAPRADLGALLSGSIKDSFNGQLLAAACPTKEREHIAAFFRKVLEHGGSMRDIRQAITRFATPEQALISAAGRTGVVPPTLSVDPLQLAERFAKRFHRFAIVRNDGIDTFFTKVASMVSREQAIAFVEQLDDNHLLQLKEKARKLGIEPPTLEYDFSAIFTLVNSGLQNSKALFTDALKKFVVDRVREGRDPNKLMLAFNRLTTNGDDIEKSCRDYGIVLSGIEFPNIAWDQNAALTLLQNSTAGWPGGFTAERLRGYCSAALQTGASPDEVASFVKMECMHGRERADKSLSQQLRSAMPRLPIDEAALIDHWKTAWGEQLSSAQEQELARDLPKAMANAKFVLAGCYSRTPDSIVAYVRKCVA